MYHQSSLSSTGGFVCNPDYLNFIANASGNLRPFFLSLLI